MGQTDSKNEKIFLSVFKHMMASRGVKVSEDTLKDFFDFIKKVSPWFLEDGTLTLSDWKKVGREMRHYVQENGENVLPSFAYPLWLQTRELLTDSTDFEGLIHETASVEDEREARPINVPKNAYGSNLSEYRHDTVCFASIDPDDWDLDDEAAKYQLPEDRDHHPYFTKAAFPRPKSQQKNLLVPPVGFHAALVEARKEGDLSFSYPVVKRMDGEHPTWEPLPLKILKELQSAVRTFGPSAPYTIQVLDMVATHWLTPHDWHQTAEATLSPEDYDLWQTEYEDLSKQTVTQFSQKRGPKPGMDMLLGTGAYTAPFSQVSIPRDVLEAVTHNAITAWRKLAPPGAKGSTTLTGIRQSNEESYQDFISRLEEAVNRMLPPSEGTDMVLKQLAWENANPLCQYLIRPIRKTGTIQDYVKACLDASPVVVQGLAYAAAVKGQKFSSYVKQIYGGGRQSSQPICFKCGGIGHMQNQCIQSVSNNKFKNPPSTVCPRCQKGKHWKKDCRSKFHKNGSLIDKDKEPEKETPAPKETPKN